VAVASAGPCESFALRSKQTYNFDSLQADRCSSRRPISSVKALKINK